MCTGAAVQLGHRAHAIEQAGVATGRAAVLAAARERIVPFSQSALLTAAVVAPAAVWGSRAGLEFLYTVAVTMLGGLVSPLLVQAFVLPAFLTVTAGQTSAPDAPPDIAPAPEPQHTA